MANSSTVEVMMGHDEEEPIEPPAVNELESIKMADNSVSYVEKWLELTDVTALARLYTALLKQFG